jgi:hypothetical protein
MSGSSETLEGASPELAPPQTLGAVFGGELAPASELGDETVRRLSVLVAVADTVTRRLSLDHQLPRLIELIVEAVDAERDPLPA